MYIHNIYTCSASLFLHILLPLFVIGIYVMHHIMQKHRKTHDAPRIVGISRAPGYEFEYVCVERDGLRNVSVIQKANNWIRFGFVEFMYILITNKLSNKQTRKNGYWNETKSAAEMKRYGKWIKMSTKWWLQRNFRNSISSIIE